MSSVNKALLLGRLGADPEVRRTQDGRPIVNIRLATSDSWRDKATGEKRERTEWHRVVIWNENLAKVAEQYLRKGSKVYVEGQIQTRKWQDQQGQDRYATEIVLQGFGCQLVLLDRAPDDTASTDSRGSGHESWARPAPAQSRPSARDDMTTRSRFDVNLPPAGRLAAF